MSQNDNQLYYIKIRGRSHGPFNLDKVRGLVRKGQISRVHTISLDGSIWQTASEFPEVFEANNTYGNVKGNASLDNHHAPVDAKAWYYNEENEPVGPLALNELIEVINRKRLSGTHLFWREGMDKWSTGASIEELKALFREPMIDQTLTKSNDDQTRRRRANSRQSEGVKNSENLTASTVNYIRSVSSWMLFVSIMGYIYCGLQITQGIFLIALNPKLIPSGAVCIFFGALIFVGSLFLNQSVISFRKSVVSSRPSDLEGGFQAQNRFWTFVGYALITLTLMIVFLIIFFFSAIVELTQNQIGG